VFLLYLGITTALAKPASQPVSTKASGIGSAYASTLFLTCTNPMTILSFVAIFAGFRIVLAAGNFLPAVLLVVGVFVGSATWWLVLSGGVNLLRTRFDLRALRWVNSISGIVIISFALIALTGLVRGV
jgi:threonine/homoserine/homoserine lactone efflux protein